MKLTSHIGSAGLSNLADLTNFIRCGLTGWCLEVFWTGLGSLLSSDRKMTGTTSLIMFPIYGMAALFQPVYQLIKNRNMLFRGGVYTCCIFTAEYLSGSFLRLFHMCPWDYSGSRFAIQGLIRLDYAPVWFFTGLLMERIVRGGVPVIQKTQSAGDKA